MKAKEYQAILQAAAEILGGAMHAVIDAALLIGRNQPAAELEDDEKFLKLRPTYYLDKL